MAGIQSYVITDLLSVSLLVVSIVTIYLAERVGHRRSRYLAIKSIEAVIGSPIVNKPSHGKFVLMLIAAGIIYLVMLPLWQGIFEAMNAVSPYLNIVPFVPVAAFYMCLGWFNLPAGINNLIVSNKLNIKRLERALFWSEWEISLVVAGAVILFPIFQKFFNILATEYPDFPRAQFSEFGSLATYAPSYIFTLYFILFLIVIYLLFRIGHYGYFLAQGMKPIHTKGWAYKLWLTRPDIESIRYSLTLHNVAITVHSGGERFTGLVVDIGDELFLKYPKPKARGGSRVAIKWSSITSVSK